MMVYRDVGWPIYRRRRILHLASVASHFKLRVPFDVARSPRGFGNDTARGPHTRRTRVSKQTLRYGRSSTHNPVIRRLGFLGRTLGPSPCGDGPGTLVSDGRGIAEDCRAVGSTLTQGSYLISSSGLHQDCKCAKDRPRMDCGASTD